MLFIILFFLVVITYIGWSIHELIIELNTNVNKFRLKDK